MTLSCHIPTIIDASFSRTPQLFMAIKLSTIAIHHPQWLSSIDNSWPSRTIDHLSTVHLHLLTLWQDILQRRLPATWTGSLQGLTTEVPELVRFRCVNHCDDFYWPDWQSPQGSTVYSLCFCWQKNCFRPNHTAVLAAEGLLGEVFAEKANEYWRSRASSIDTGEWLWSISRPEARNRSLLRAQVDIITVVSSTWSNFLG